MSPAKPLSVFGNKVEITVDGEMSHGVSSVVISTVPAGGSPPPQTHTYEDELFMALEGDFELFANGKWQPLAIDEPVFSPRGTLHTFRNTGKTPGRIATIYAPAGFEQWYEEVNGLSPAKDMKKLTAISADYGMTIAPKKE